jgi:hypothetical protein
VKSRGSFEPIRRFLVRSFRRSILAVDTHNDLFRPLSVLVNQHRDRASIAMRTNGEKTAARFRQHALHDIAAIDDPIRYQRQPGAGDHDRSGHQ